MAQKEVLLHEISQLEERYKALMGVGSLGFSNHGNQIDIRITMEPTSKIGLAACKFKAQILELIEAEISEKKSKLEQS